MTPNPILKVLSTFSKHRVQYLLIGGQACIIYGASEFSRDSDFFILSSMLNLSRLRRALSELKCRQIYVPALKQKYLEKGHACHFRCHAKGFDGLRIDVFSKLRGCEDFTSLWDRRFEVKVSSGHRISVINIRDLVSSKKTQREKDWFMLERLVENDMILHQPSLDADRIRWWLCECRNTRQLIELCQKHRILAKEQISTRPLLKTAIRGEEKKLMLLLKLEKMREQEKDIVYWDPLKKELELLRGSR